MAYKFFRFPWATSGDTDAVPDTDPGTGEVSYQTGYGPDYSESLASNPDALPIERDKFNKVIQDITEAIRAWQIMGTPPFITDAMNGGTPFSYANQARVIYGGVLYESLIDSNTDLPTVTTSWLAVPPPSIVVNQFAGSTGGSANALTLTPPTPIVSNKAGQRFSAFITTTNTGAATLAASGKPALPIQKTIGSALVALAPGDLQAGTLVEFENVDDTKYQVLNIRSDSKSADIASAATIDLNAMTGTYGVVTGAVGINAMTLAEGQRRLLRFAGALTITNGVNLILKGNANITTAAGDICEVIGEAGGIVRMTDYDRADGISLYQPNTAATPVTIGTGTLTITPGEKIWQKITATGPFTIAFNFPANKVTSMILQCINFGGYVITWPTMNKQGGILPTFTTAGQDIVVVFQDVDNIIHFATISMNDKSAP
jgi:hypothetical protein